MTLDTALLMDNDESIFPMNSSPIEIRDNLHLFLQSVTRIKIPVGDRLDEYRQGL